MARLCRKGLKVSEYEHSRERQTIQASLLFCLFSFISLLTS